MAPHGSPPPHRPSSPPSLARFLLDSSLCPRCSLGTERSPPIFPRLLLLAVRSQLKCHLLRKTFSDEPDSITCRHIPLLFPFVVLSGMVLIIRMCVFPFSPTPTEMQAPGGRGSAWHTIGTIHSLNAGVGAGQTPSPLTPRPRRAPETHCSRYVFMSSLRRHCRGSDAQARAPPLTLRLQSILQFCLVPSSHADLLEVPGGPVITLRSLCFCTSCSLCEGTLFLSSSSTGHDRPYPWFLGFPCTLCDF